jgi:hypothetical protein
MTTKQGIFLRKLLITIVNNSTKTNSLGSAKICSARWIGKLLKESSVWHLLAGRKQYVNSTFSSLFSPVFCFVLLKAYMYEYITYSITLYTLHFNIFFISFVNTPFISRLFISHSLQSIFILPFYTYNPISFY